MHGAEFNLRMDGDGGRGRNGMGGGGMEWEGAERRYLESVLRITLK